MIERTQSVCVVSSRDGLKENVGCVVVEMRAQQQHRNVNEDES